MMRLSRGLVAAAARKPHADQLLVCAWSARACGLRARTRGTQQKWCTHGVRVLTKFAEPKHSAA
eukprot:11204948-Lingulodinium_polyedra.AAC.1